MEISPEITEIFADPDRIVALECTYKNGGKVAGTLRKVKQAPLRVVVQKSDPARGERPRHKVVFDHVISLQVTFDDGSVQIFT